MAVNQLGRDLRGGKRLRLADVTEDDHLPDGASAVDEDNQDIHILNENA